MSEWFAAHPAVAPAIAAFLFRVLWEIFVPRQPK
jgi:hypothetical protein